MSADQFVALYLYRTKSVFESSFVTLWLTRSEHSETDLEKDIQFWEQMLADDPTATHAENWRRSFQNNLDYLRAERAAYGETFIHMATAAVAASIISMADHGVRMAKQRGKVVEDRVVHSGHRLQKFVRLSSDHGSHFWEDVTEAHQPRLDFQKKVLGYDQQADGTNINHSETLLVKLGWSRCKDVETDLLKLFGWSDSRN